MKKYLFVILCMLFIVVLVSWRTANHGKNSQMVNTDSVAVYYSEQVIIDDEDFYNPIVVRLSDKEIREAKTPAAIAYNFVVAIYEEDYSRMLKYLSKTVKNDWKNESKESLHEIFSKPNSKLDILGWKSCIQDGFEIAVLYEQDEYFSKKIYVHCVPSSEIGVKRFQEITRCNEANPKVLLDFEGNTWKVIGFK